MTAPATLDGGDCLRFGHTIYIGRSARTNAAGVARATEIFGARGFRIVSVDLPTSVLHLKCVCTRLDDQHVLLAEGTIAPEVFAGTKPVWVPHEESYAANAVAIGRDVVIADGFPRTRDAVEGAGFTAYPVSTSEFRKADGSLTCLSILVD